MSLYSSCQLGLWTHLKAQPGEGGSASKLTQVVGRYWSLHRAASVSHVTSPRVGDPREWEIAPKMEGAVCIYNLFSEVTSYHFCSVLFIKSKSVKSSPHWRVGAYTKTWILNVGPLGAVLEDTHHHTYISKGYFWKDTLEIFNIGCLQGRELGNWGRIFH